MNTLLDVVNRRAESGSIVGKRDYALLVFFLLTGLRRSEVINLRGKNFEYKDGKFIIRYRRKGGKYVGREVSDPLVYDALIDYLKASGRADVLKSDRPLWTRHDRAGRPGAPLSSRAFANNLKKYGKEAGLDRVHLHQTRHTFARIVAEETGSYHETQEALDHENEATTRVYVQRITVKSDKHSGKVAQRLRRHR
jgi:integrase